MKNKRNTKLINPKVQKWFIIINLCTVLFSFILSSFAVFISFTAMKENFLKTLSPNSPLFNLLQAQQFNIILAMIIILIVTLIISLYFSYSLSHKLVGPIYRIEKALKDIIETNNTDQEITIRKEDFFQDLPDLLNKLIGKIK